LEIIWLTRKLPLVDAVANRCKEIINIKCKEKGWEILELAIQSDHIHLFLKVWPSDSPADVVKEIKGITSHNLRKEFPHLLKLPSMWTRSYFSATAGNVSSETIKKYIEAQKGV
jgi:putative transposase